jgi:hypothetical protein
VGLIESPAAGTSLTASPVGEILVERVEQVEESGIA